MIKNVSKSIGLLSLVLVSGISSAQAASSGTLILSGVVTVVNDISVAAIAGANDNLNITGGERNKDVANVTETSNDLDGYTVQIYSSNGGTLVNAADPSKSTSYQISYDGGTAVAVPTSTSPAVVKRVGRLNGLTSTTSRVRLNVNALSSAPSGTYADTVTFAIVAN